VCFIRFQALLGTSAFGGKLSASPSRTATCQCGVCPGASDLWLPTQTRALGIFALSCALSAVERGPLSRDRGPNLGRRPLAGLRRGLPGASSALRPPKASGQTKPLADPSRGVVAVLSDRWRVIDDGVQWILQKAHGRPTAKSTGWRGRSYCTSRKSLLDSVERWRCGPGGLRVLEALPDDHPREGLPKPQRGG
jgi:hypothetical protein